MPWYPLPPAELLTASLVRGIGIEALAIRGQTGEEDVDDIVVVRAKAGAEVVAKVLPLPPLEPLERLDSLE